MGKDHTQCLPLTASVVSFVEKPTWFFHCASAEENKCTSMVSKHGHWTEYLLLDKILLTQIQCKHPTETKSTGNSAMQIYLFYQSF